MTDDPRREDHRKDYSVLDHFIVGSRMVDDYTEDSAVRDFLEMHPEANETDVRAELKRELEAEEEQRRQHRERIERERAQEVE